LRDKEIEESLKHYFDALIDLAKQRLRIAKEVLEEEEKERQK